MQKTAQNTLSIQEMTAFWKLAIGQWWFILGRNFKEPKAYKNDSANTLQYYYAKIR